MSRGSPGVPNIYETYNARIARSGPSQGNQYRNVPYMCGLTRPLVRGMSPCRTQQGADLLTTHARRFGMARHYRVCPGASGGIGARRWPRRWPRRWRGGGRGGGAVVAEAVARWWLCLVARLHSCRSPLTLCSWPGHAALHCVTAGLGSSWAVGRVVQGG